MSSTMLPGELVEEILFRLPVKSVLRFRCASKSWRALIDSSTFINSHLSKNLNSNGYIFRPQYKSDTETGVEIKLINWSNQALDSIHSNGPILFESLNLPVSCPVRVNVLGSCNGLIALLGERSDQITLINPSTRAYELLPPYNNHVGFHCGGFAYGLGYDCFADEYKVVIRPLKVDPTKEVEVKIWGSKSKIWRKIHCSFNYNTYRDLIHLSWYGKYTNGALHWILGDQQVLKSSRNKTKLIQIEAFDLVTERFMSTEYDAQVFDAEGFGIPACVQLEVLGECLCLCSRPDAEKGATDIWVMKKYGVKESWGKLASLPEYAEPLVLSACGRHLIFLRLDWPIDKCYLHWYDVDKKSMECFGSINPTRRSDYYPQYCAQSLVRLPEKLSQHV